MSIGKLTVKLPKIENFEPLREGYKEVIHRYKTEWIQVGEPSCLTPRVSFKENDFGWSTFPTLSLDNFTNAENVNVPSIVDSMNGKLNVNLSVKAD